MEQQYLNLIKDVLTTGELTENRTGIKTWTKFGAQIRFDLSDSVWPLMTTRKVFWKSVVGELLWFLSGSTDVAELREKYGVRFWDPWVKDDGTIGPLYGFNWVGWPGYDGKPINQIENLIDEIKNNPNSRRLLVSAWNVPLLDEGALHPCHTMFQMHVQNGKLSCQMYQRSSDLGAGIPVNIASYSLLTHMIAHVCDLEPGEYIHTFGNYHVYENQVDVLHRQLRKEIRPLPTLKLNPEAKDIFSFTPDDFEVEGYDPHPYEKMPIAV